MHTWSCTLEVTTPMALAGVNQKRAELRPNTFKNRLRWWWRAGRGRLDREREARLFGDLGREDMEGEKVKGNACPFRLRLYPCNWKAENSVSFDEFLGEEQLLNDDRNHRLKGLGYLGHYLDPPENPPRGVIRPGAQFRVKFVFPSWFGKNFRRELWASLWLLVWFGGLGARSRRGFGGLKVVDSNLPTGDLELAFQGKTTEALCSFLESNLHRARRWLDAPTSREQSKPEYTAIVPEWTRIFVDDMLVNGSADRREYSYSEAPGWAKALDAAGGDLRHYRNERPTAYGEVSRFITRAGYEPNTVDRAAFGLPLTFWYPPIQKRTGSRSQATAEVGQHQRRASPLFVRVHQTNEQFEMFALVYVLMKAQLLPEGDQIEMSCEARGRFENVAQPDFSRVDDFFDDSSFSDYLLPVNLR
jgi:CRISPR-associated protein Cmr1